MTIDKKVVAWLLDSGGNRTYWADEETARKEYSNLCVLGYRGDTTLTPLIPQSACAELAADRDLWMSMATFEGKVSASVLDDLHTTQAQLAEERELRMSLESSWQQAEAQLAELRVKCERLVDRWANDSNYSFYECEHDLRTLAAADGGGK